MAVVDFRSEDKSLRQENEPHRLDVVQRWFQTVITDDGGVQEGMESSDAQKLIPLARGQLEQVIRRSSNLRAEERLSIYANAYYARLVECLAECFPVLKKAVGNEIFESFAVEYLQHHPPQSYTLDKLGEHFSRFLEETRPDLSQEGKPPEKPNWPDFLIDLCRLEWTIAKVFDGPGIEDKAILTAADLQDLAPERFGEARLIPVVCLRLLTFRYPVNSYYTAARRCGKDEEPPIPPPGAQHVAITRYDYIVRRFELTYPQKVLLETLRSGKSVAEAIAVAANASEREDDELAEQLHSWFSFWTSERFFQSIEFPDTAFSEGARSKSRW